MPRIVPSNGWPEYGSCFESPMENLSLFKRTYNRDDFTRGARALLALGLVFAVDWLADWQGELMPVLLGVIASALTETDDHWQGRLRAQLIAMSAFSALAWAVWASLPWPVLLMAVLALSAFSLTMLGALGERYRAITFGALVLFLYVALSAHTSRSHANISTPLLLTGAAWYGVVSVLWAAIWPQPPVRYRLSKLYILLGEYLRLKAQLLEPIREADLAERRMNLVLQNGRVVDALNAAKESLLSRIQSGPLPKWLQLAMQQYLAAQDIHERASSSHENYHVLSDAFFHSDALYRSQRVLILLGQQATQVAAAIQTQTPPKHQGATTRGLEDLHAAIQHIEVTDQVQRPLKALHALSDNLTATAAVFASIFTLAPNEADHQLLDRQPATPQEAWARVRDQLNFSSPLFRHALRLSASLVAGFAVMQATHDPKGYWILLTIVFVSQQHYAATLTRLMQRTSGTVVGLALGWALTQLFQPALVQSALIVILGAVFLGNRHTRYWLATAAVTTLLVLSFHQIGMRQDLFPERLWDTLIGCAIAGVASWLLLPNWQWRLWPKLSARSLRAQAAYLEAIVRQYQLGKDDHLDYRLARRNAHNADAALSNAYSAMRKEPSRVRHHEASSGRFLLLSHTLLSYLSALGAHRDEWHGTPLPPFILNSASTLQKQLTALAQALEDHRPSSVPTSFLNDHLTFRPDAHEPHSTQAVERLWQAQLQLGLQLMPELAQHATQFNNAP